MISARTASTSDSSSCPALASFVSSGALSGAAVVGEAAVGVQAEAEACVAVRVGAAAKVGAKAEPCAVINMAMAFSLLYCIAHLQKTAFSSILGVYLHNCPKH